MGLSLARNQDTARTTVPRDWHALLERPSEDARYAWEERAAIIQYDGGEPRPTAERRAIECILAEFSEVRQAISANRKPASIRGAA